MKGLFLKEIARTFFSKSFILVANFLILLLSTQYLGAEGRGVVSIMITNVALVAIFNNIFCGSSFIYHLPKVGQKPLVVPALLWVLFISTLSSLVFCQIQPDLSFFWIFSLTLVTSLGTLTQSFFLGREELSWFNGITLFTVLIQLVLFFSILAFYHQKTPEAFFISYLISQGVVSIFVWFWKGFFTDIRKASIHWSVCRELFSYGWRNELSYILQFLNYRLTYFFILYYLGLSSVGVFSVAIAVAESIWLVAKSITTVQYARLVRTHDKIEAVELTKNSAWISFVFSFLLLALLIALPDTVYQWVLGHDFAKTRELLWILSPGILGIAVSNVFGHFFAAQGNMKILIVKSVLGLIVTLLAALILLPEYGLLGGSIVSSLSYVISSFYLFFQFYKWRRSTTRISFTKRNLFVDK